MACHNLFGNNGINIVPLMLPLYTDLLINKVLTPYKENRIFIKVVRELKDNNAFNIICHEKPDAIMLSGDTGPIYRSFVLIAKKLGIPIVIIREAIPSKVLKIESKIVRLFELAYKSYSSLPKQLNHFLFFARSLLTSGYFSFLQFLEQSIELIDDLTYGVFGRNSDYILAVTHRDAHFFRLNCPLVRSVFVVGNPRFDSIIQKEKLFGIKKLRLNVTSFLKVPKNKRIVLFISTAYVAHGILNEKDNLQIHSYILENFKVFKKDFHFIIKLHPSEKNFYPKIWKKEYDAFISITDYDLNELILSSDYVISWFSTSLINVMLAEKPLLIIDFYDYRSKLPIAPRDILEITPANAALEVVKKEDFPSFLRVFLNDLTIQHNLKISVRKYRKKYLNEINGASNALILEFFQKIFY